MRDAIEGFLTRMGVADGLALAGADDATIQGLVSDSCSALDLVFREHVERGATGVDATAVLECLRLSRTVDRSYTKPRGYAGDFYTIEMLYNDEAAGDGRLGRFIDRWCLQLHACQAVKNRRKLLSKAIREVCRANTSGPTRVTSLASGPARELFDLFAPGGRRLDLDVTCIDIDDQALDYAAGIADALGVTDRFRFAQDNVVRLAYGRGRTVLPPQHMIYSVGLIDYFQDDLVVKLLDWIHEELLPGGTVILGNFAPSNPTKAFMDHVLDWKLIHRSADHLKALFQRSRFEDAPVDVVGEEAGVNLFAFCTKEWAARCAVGGRPYPLAYPLAA